MSSPIPVPDSAAGKLPNPDQAWRVYLIKLMVRDRRLIAATLAIFLAIALLLAFAWPATYESSAVLMPSEQPSMGGAMGMNPLIGMALMSGVAENAGLHTPGAKFIAILHSKTLADRLIDRYGLMSGYRVKLRSAARNRLADQTLIVEDRRTGAITINVRDHDKKLAKDLTQGYTEELNRLNADLNTGAAHQQHMFLDQRLEEVKGQINKTATALANFSSKSAIFAPEQQLKVETESAAQLQGQVVGLQATLSGLLERYTDKNLRVQEVKAQIASIQRQLQKMKGSQSDLNASERDQLFPTLAALPHLQVTYAGLMRDSKSLNAIYEVLEQQLELSKIDEVKELPTVRVLDAPEVADRRLSPKRSSIFVMFTLLGVLVGILCVIVRDHYRTRGFASPQKYLRSLMGQANASFTQEPRS